MLSRVRQQSIHRHLAKVGAFITSLVGGIFLVVLLGVSLVSSREELLESTSALTSVLASNLTASVAFRDPATAAELLSGLDAVPDVLEAMLFLPDGTAFAYYRPGNLPSTNLPDQGYLETLTIPVQLEREQIATLRVKVDLWPVYQRLIWVSLLAALLWLVGILAAYILSRTLNARITQPLSALAGMMSEVTDREDYSRRFSYEQNNELGLVVDAFNELMERTEDREQRLKAMITALVKARDEAEAAARSKTSFLANMSHEIRTPMNGIMGMIALLQRGELSTQQRAYFETIERSSEALLTIIDDILDFTKIEAGRLVLIREPFDLFDSIASIEALFVETAKQKGLALKVDISQAVPQRIVGDPGRIRQVLLNLIGNAIKFTDQGSVSLSVRVLDNQTLPALKFTVADTGPGILPEDEERIFGEFFQADVSLTRAHGGTGLGLAIAQQLVTLMQGSIGYAPNPVGGSHFWFDIPLMEAPSNEVLGPAISALTASQARAEMARLGRLTNTDSADAAPEVSEKKQIGSSAYELNVLVAEDSEVNQFIIRELLVEWGVNVSVVADGAAAVEAFKSEGFDLILMDIQMPKMDGLEATRLIRSLQRKESINTDCIVVGLSAHAMSGDREKYMAEGMADYLTKPIRPAALQAILDACLKHQVE
jgi:signal transduction histidine kinase/ActR/RegA family two-component response regulator